MTAPRAKPPRAVYVLYCPGDEGFVCAYWAGTDKSVMNAVAKMTSGRELLTYVLAEQPAAPAPAPKRRKRTR